MHCVHVQRGAYPPVTSARLFLEGSAKFLFNASALLWLWLFLQIIGANVIAGWVGVVIGWFFLYFFKAALSWLPAGS